MGLEDKAPDWRSVASLHADRAANGDDTPRADHERHERRDRHSDVVPTETARPSAHLSWRESPRTSVPDETRSVWMQAYEAGFDEAFAKLDKGDLLIPLVYAARANDGRLTRALLRFAYEIALRLSDTDAALAVLEVAESTQDNHFDKDVCARIAENLIEEAYQRFCADRRFDNYFFCHCAAAVARLASHVDSAVSARDAIEAIQSAAAALRVHDKDAEDEVRRLAAHCIRSELVAGRRSDPTANKPAS